MNLGSVSTLFADNFSSLGELGASVSVWHNGIELLNLGAGFQDRQRTTPWQAETPILFWSATKGMSAACLLHACQAHGITLTEHVATIWPEFGAAGKSEVRLDQLLSHQAGLAALTQEVSVLDYDAVSRALANEAPLWPLGTGHGYHPRTFGFLLDELVRRLSGMTLGQYWKKVFAEPLELDLWIGAPEERAASIAPIFPAKSAPPSSDPFYQAFMTPGSLTSRAFGSPRGLHSPASMNTVESRTASFPAFGGIGSASSLAKFYAMLAQGGTYQGQRWFDSGALGWMTTTLTQGRDQVLQMETAFSAGFMRDPLDEHGHKLRQNFGPSKSAFGHPGAGGSTAFADPETGLAFAYVMNQMEPGVLPNQKSLRLIAALYS